MTERRGEQLPRKIGAAAVGERNGGRDGDILPRRADPRLIGA